jgi:hypothetical protein
MLLCTPLTNTLMLTLCCANPIKIKVDSKAQQLLDEYAATPQGSEDRAESDTKIRENIVKLFVQKYVPYQTIEKWQWQSCISRLMSKRTIDRLVILDRIALVW